MNPERHESKVAAPETASADSSLHQAPGTHTIETLSSERMALNKLDQLNLSEKLSLTPQQGETLRKMESSILQGDFNTLAGELHKFKDDPDGATPIMNVLVNDLASAGIHSRYSVDFPLTDGGKGPAEKSGMFHLSTETDANNSINGDNKFMCLYTNPRSNNWSEHEVPGASKGQGYSTPDHRDIPSDLALREIGTRAASNLLEKKR